MAKFNVCAQCGAEAPEGEEPQHFANCPKHPNNLALARVQQIRNTGGNTKDFQAEVASRDIKPDHVADAPRYAPQLYPEEVAPFTGSAEIRLSKEAMEYAMEMYLRSQFNLSGVKVERVTGNSSKGFLVKFGSKE